MSQYYLVLLRYRVVNVLYILPNIFSEMTRVHEFVSILTC